MPDSKKDIGERIKSMFPTYEEFEREVMQSYRDLKWLDSFVRDAHFYIIAYRSTKDVIANSGSNECLDAVFLEIKKRYESIASDLEKMPDTERGKVTCLKRFLYNANMLDNLRSLSIKYHESDYMKEFWEKHPEIVTDVIVDYKLTSKRILGKRIAELFSYREFEKYLPNLVRAHDELSKKGLDKSAIEYFMRQMIEKELGKKAEDKGDCGIG